MWMTHATPTTHGWRPRHSTCMMSKATCPNWTLLTMAVSISYVGGWGGVSMSGRSVQTLTLWRSCDLGCGTQATKAVCGTLGHCQPCRDETACILGWRHIRASAQGTTNSPTWSCRFWELHCLIYIYILTGMRMHVHVCTVYLMVLCNVGIRVCAVCI